MVRRPVRTIGTRLQVRAGSKFAPVVRTISSHFWFATTMARTWLVVTSAVTRIGYQSGRLQDARFPLWFPRYRGVFHWLKTDLQNNPMNETGYAKTNPMNEADRGRMPPLRKHPMDDQRQPFQCQVLLGSSV